MFPGLDAIHWATKIFNDNKDAKTDKEDEARRLTERRYAKHCGAKSINLYAAMLSGASKEELKDIYPINDKKFTVTEEGLKSVKVEPDITITQKQAKRWLKVILVLLAVVISAVLGSLLVNYSGLPPYVSFPLVVCCALSFGSVVGKYVE